MATGNRTLKLSILADIDDLKKKLDQADNAVETNSSKMADFGKKAAAAFAVAAAAAVAYAGKLAIDGVKSAIADEQAQLRLASALKTATGATNAQIAATESYISKTQLAVGVSDDELRPSLQRLAVATGSVEKSQSLLNLALDVSRGTGKPLEAVVEALGKAYEGQSRKLGTLGIGLSAAELKTMSFQDVQEKLSNLYGGAAARNADTFQGRIDRLTQAFNEGKEAVGVALLPVIENLIGYVLNYGVPVINKFKKGWDVVSEAIENNKENFQEFIFLLQTYVLPVLGKVFSFVIEMAAKTTSTIISVFGTIVGAITPTINFIIDAINKVIAGLNLIKPGSDIGFISKIGASSSNFTYGGGNPAISGTTTVPTVSMSSGMSVPSIVSGGGTIPKTSAAKSAAQAAADMALVSTFGATATTEQALRSGILPTPGIVNNITVNGAIDSESSARQIVDIINQSYGRGGVVISTPFKI
jgi:hypothetical protein